MITDILIAVLLLSGGAFSLIAALGIVRLPDFYMRMHAATKASAFGLVLIFGGGAIFFADILVTLEILLIIFFVYVTAPVAAHLIGRAAYHMNVPLWKETQVDELAGKGSAPRHDEVRTDRKEGVASERKNI
ncbi:MAG: monovalent cation/H(+) antiporter subunit G [Bacteroidota bacterium]|nr:monovalent cation/H(+) antiporter subunit G [Bacteroidota bacterium]